MRKLQVCILDYGSGNVGSVLNIMRLISPEVVVSNSPKDIKSATHLILPGVGAFGASMSKILSTIPLEILKHEVFVKQKPFLGICVGMQVLADKGLEFGEHAGLGWMPGVVRRIEADDLPLPHVGWNDVSLKNNNKLFAGFQADPDFYFVHSYCFVPLEKKNIVATTKYGEEFASAVSSANIYGVQFHPEKSQQAGRILLENFCKI